MGRRGDGWLDALLPASWTAFTAGLTVGVATIFVVEFVHEDILGADGMGRTIGLVIGIPLGLATNALMRRRRQSRRGD